MLKLNSAVAAAVLAALFIASPAMAHADEPVPTVDEVLTVMASLTNPNRPAANKTDIVAPGFTPDEAGAIDDHLTRMNAAGLLPYNFVLTDIHPAPANFAGATVTVTGNFNQRSAPQPMVLALQGGHWLITHDTAMTALDNFWYNTNRQARHFVTPGI